MNLQMATSFFAILLSSAVSTVAQADDGELSHAKRVVTSRLESLQSLRVQYAQVQSFTPPEAMVKKLGEELKQKDGRTHHLGTAHIESSAEKVDFLADRMRYEVNLTGETLKLSQAERFMLRSDRTILTFTPSRVERLSQDHKTTDADPAFGFVYNVTDQQPAETFVDLALGLRMRGDRKWITAHDVQQMAVSILPGEGILFQNKGDIVIQQWIFDNNHDYSLIKYRLISPKSLNPSVEFLSEDFQKIDGVMLPTRITCKDIIQLDDGTPYVTRTTKLTNLSYKLNDPENVPELYKIIWPLNSVVRDNRTGTVVKVTSKPRTIDDADFNDSAKRQDENKAQALKDAQGLLDKEGQR